MSLKFPLDFGGFFYGFYVFSGFVEFLLILYFFCKSRVFMAGRFGFGFVGFLLVLCSL